MQHWLLPTFLKSWLTGAIQCIVQHIKSWMNSLQISKLKVAVFPAKTRQKKTIELWTKKCQWLSIENPGSSELTLSCSICASVKKRITFTVQLRWFFKIPPRTGGVDFLAHRGSFWYPTPIPTATDFSPTALPPSSLCKTTHLPEELRGGLKFIMASSQWKISDVRMIDSSEFFRVCTGRKSEPYFAYASFGWFATE